ncbi:MAG: cobalamin biosynthesis protein CobW [Rhodobacter sp.]|nr:cobalamin biosynthesis protein CobW [Rhodobacter sp.]MCY4167825.1 cobalamin biosynthesis protein CobW [Rhodobacter sp.]
MPFRIPATIITGFLGSGKTTLIRHLLRNAGGRRIALVINEFGELGIDGELLRHCGEDACADSDVLELSNGCICCTVAEDFLPAMRMLLDRDTPPDHIVIETSGLALPQPLVRAFNWPEISTRVTVDGVVTVVDGCALSEGRFVHSVSAVDAQRRADDSLDHDTPISELFEDQVACADMIVINKRDLMADGEADALAERLEGETRDGVHVVRTSMGALPVDVLLGRGQAAEGDISRRREVHHGHHDDDSHDHGEFESFIVTRPEIVDPRTFAETVAKVVRVHDILRIKGFAAVTGKPMRLVVQAVGPRIGTYFDRPLDGRDDRGARLVVIGRSGIDRAAVAAALSA